MNDNRLADLMNGCRRYDRTCQKEVYELFYRYALSVALRYTSSIDEAREIVNDAFFQVFSKIDHYDPKQPFQPWLHTITVRTAIDYYRKYHLHKMTVIDLAEIQEVAVQDTVFARIAAEDLRILVQQLSPAYRVVMNLYAIEGYAHHEIASLLGISEGASKSNLFKARVKLKKMLEQQEDSSRLTGNDYGKLRL
jgi:RNA polymerase sigma factor (sigma-70 family)